MLLVVVTVEVEDDDDVVLTVVDFVEDAEEVVVVVALDEPLQVSRTTAFNEEAPKPVTADTLFVRASAGT